MTTKTLLLDTGYACAGIVTEGEPPFRVVEAAPIFKWMIGKRLIDVMNWRKLKRMTELRSK